MLFPHYIPEDLNVETLLSYLPQGSYGVVFRGHHYRNAYNDIVDVERTPDERVLIGISRNSIYNSLPEYLFHPIDRFNNLPRLEEKERFEEEVKKQNEEKENAYHFFSPVDLQILKYRLIIRERLRSVTENNSVLIGILGDRLTEEQKNNRFIKKALQFLPSCKYIRGDKTLLTLMLRKIFMDEGIKVSPKTGNQEFIDDDPRYAESLGSIIESTYVGRVYDEQVMLYEVCYWPENVDDTFLSLVDEIEEFRIFVQDYFIAVDAILHFDISHDESCLRLSDNQTFNYLNYNTNL